MKNKCIDCNKLLKYRYSKRCYSCENKRKHKMDILNSKGKKSPTYKSGKYCKSYYCKDCGKKISVLSTRCKQCHYKFNKGKNHSNYKHITHKQYYCKNKKCNNKISYNNWRDGSGRCKKCAGKLHSKRMKRNPFHSKSIAKPHLYLKKNNDKILKLTYSKHAQLHNKAYDYIYEIQGKKGINKYLKWFKENYGLK